MTQGFCAPVYDTQGDLGGRQLDGLRQAVHVGLEVGGAVVELVQERGRVDVADGGHADLNVDLLVRLLKLRVLI